MTDPRLSISIIVPTLNEAAHLPRTLASIRRAPGDEVIVVDGGSRDDTVAIAHQGGADRVVSAPTGRAPQLNQGAALARGHALLFLHADTTLSTDALAHARQAMRDPTIALAAMRLRINSSRRTVRAIAPLVNLRTRLFSRPYGDQGMILRRQVFYTLNGFRDLPIMEDIDLIRRAARLGRIALLPATATTSGRRWEAHGVAHTTLVNVIAALRFRLGASPAQLRPWYDRWLGLSERSVPPADAPTQQTAHVQPVQPLQSTKR